ncbi:MAG: NYN domain-containing protein [Ktedonobacterales bacterium]
MGPRTILVDGYNVIRNIPGLAAAERVSLQHGRETLLKQIAARYRHTPHRVMVVFDGNGPVESTHPLPGLARGQVIYSRAGESADQVIRRLGEQEQAAGADCVAVSDDFEVRAGVQVNGGSGAGVQDLAIRLNEPSKYQRRQYQHRKYLRQQWQEESGGEAKRSSDSKLDQRKQKRRSPVDRDLLR